MSCFCSLRVCALFFFFNATSTTEIYTLSLHDALPIFGLLAAGRGIHTIIAEAGGQDRLPTLFGLDSSRAGVETEERGDRKSTRLNSSHVRISYAVFCLKKKKKKKKSTTPQPDHKKIDH